MYTEKVFTEIQNERIREKQFQFETIAGDNQTIKGYNHAALVEDIDNARKEICSLVVFAFRTLVTSFFSFLVL